MAGEKRGAHIAVTTWVYREMAKRLIDREENLSHYIENKMREEIGAPSIEEERRQRTKERTA